MNALYLIGFVQSLFFLVLILSKKKLRLNDYFLSAYILILGLNLMFMYWNATGFHDKNPLIIILDLGYWTLLGPLLYLYIDVITSSDKKLKWSYLLHLSPFVFILIAFSGYFAEGAEGNFFKYQNSSPLFIAGYIVWMYNSPLYYIILIFKLNRHKKKIKGYYATPKSVDLKWLNYLVHGFAVFLFFLLFAGYIIRYFELDVVLNSYHFTWFVMVLYIFGIGFYGYKQQGIFSDFQEIEERKEEDKNQYKKSGLRAEEASLIQDSLETLMKRDKPYLDYDITLPKLAQAINTTSHKLSQVINEKYNANFFEYINRYRLNDLKELLQDESKSDTKIMALAYDCGFNSKSAFYNFFKKETSLTPSEFRNKYMLIEA